MNIFLQIFAFIFAIFLLVTVHEFGHFWVARKFGIKVIRFSIGFGKPIWKKIDKNGTEFVIAPIPLGGYVRLLDEREDKNIPPEDLPYAFTRKSLWARFLVIIAGPLTNLILGFLLFWTIFVIGTEDIKPIIGKVIPNSIAAQSGLKAGDQILAVNNQLSPSWQKALILLMHHLGKNEPIQLNVLPTNSSEPQQHTLQLVDWNLRGLTPKPLEALGIFPFAPNELPLIYKVLPNSQAEFAGMKNNDLILSINNQKVSTWEEFVNYVMANPLKVVNVEVLRDKKKVPLTLTVGQKRTLGLNKIGFIGVQAKPIEIPESMRVKINYPFYQAWMPAAKETFDMTAFNFLLFGKMLTGHISLQGLGGPITIFKSANQALSQGIAIYLNFLAILSIMLATINILPIPGLDGGHLLFILIEALRGKPLSLAAQTMVWRLGIVFLIALMLQATINDVLRLL